VSSYGNCSAIKITSGVEEIRNVPNTWEEALMQFRWPMNFADFKDAHWFPGWFSFDISIGDRCQTMKFEAHFREHAQEDLEVWLEVVFWKLYAIRFAANRTTLAVAKHFYDNAISEDSLWLACEHYINEPSIATFDRFRRRFGFRQQVIAVAATFPAFIAPTSYPMVDTRIAKWVAKFMHAHNKVDLSCPQLTKPRFSGKGVLMMTDYPFMRDWTRWCIHTARKLTKLTPRNWRARDVEMAVFCAYGNKGDPHPTLHLNELCN